MNLSRIGAWLWQNRKVIITAVFAYGLFQAIFYLPHGLAVWIIGLLVVLTLGVWWLSGFSRNVRQWVWLLLEIVWVTIGGLGFVIFNLLSPWAFQLAAVLVIVVIFWLMLLYEEYLSEGSWPVWSFSILDFVDLLTFFLVSSSMLLAADLFNLNFAWILAGFALQVLLAVNLRFWREKMKSRRKWFYIVLTALVSEEVLWVISFWHRSVFLKAFLTSLIFYLFADFILHYIRGTLTVRVAVEYLFMVAVLLAIVFVIDWLFVLQ